MFGWGVAVEESSPKAFSSEQDFFAKRSRSRSEFFPFENHPGGSILLFMTQEMGGARPGGE